MKRIIPIASLALIGALAFSSCKKSSNSNSNPALGTVSADINGTAWSTTSGAAVKDTVTGTHSLIIGGVDNNFKGITLSIANYSNATGTFSLEAGGYTENTTTAHAAATGSVVLTSASTSSVVGTFSFTTTDSIKITNGKFNVSIH